MDSDDDPALVVLHAFKVVLVRYREMSMRAAFGVVLLNVAALVACDGHHGPSPSMLAVKNVHLINDTEKEFRRRTGRYAELSELGRELPSLLPKGLIAGRTGGYSYGVHLTNRGYVVEAIPEKRESATSWRSVYSDETFVIRVSEGAEVATEASPELR